MKQKHYPCVLSIAGSDCSGGAGIQADIKTISALGTYAATAITAVTVQNTQGVTDVCPVPPGTVKTQIEAVMSDIRPSAVKIGMIDSAEIAQVIAESIRCYHPQFVVFDPVMISSSGKKLMEDRAIDVIREELFPLCTLITPNIDEASFLLRRDIESVNDMQLAARCLLQFGSRAVLLKGGHLRGEEMVDVLQEADGQSPTLYSMPKVISRNTHGTGCTLSSAIATYLSIGESMKPAVQKAKDYVYHCLESGKDVQIGTGHGPMNHLHSPIAMRIIEKDE